MHVTETELPGILLLQPRVFHDDRGSFLESWREDRYHEVVPARFVQDNAAVSRQGVLRGLHFQWPDPQGKLVMVLQGAVFDVAVDIRVGSPHFGQWVGSVLSAENGRQLWIPEGFAHGYVALSPVAVFSYKCTRYYNPAADSTIRYDDPAIGIQWPIEHPLVSPKDAAAPLLAELPSMALPAFPALQEDVPAPVRR